MWYTHSWNQNISDSTAKLMNRIFQKCLKNLESTSKGINLYDWFAQAMNDMPNGEALDNRAIIMRKFLDENFCETAWDDYNNIILIWENNYFLKTYRKKYDIAVYVALSLVHNAGLFINWSYDRTICEYIRDELDENMYTEKEIRHMEAIYDEYIQTMQEKVSFYL